jgi:hypothetical protein
MADSFTPDELAKMIEKNRIEADDGHVRLRIDVRLLEATVQSNFRHADDQLRLVRAEIGQVAATSSRPVDAMKLTLSTTHIVALVIAAVTIAASAWRLGEKIDAVAIAQMTQQRMNDMQIAAMQDAIKQTSARYELLRIDVQGLRETVIAKGKPQ